MSGRRSQVQNNLYILALQETYLIEDSDLKWFGTYAFTKAESNHCAGCVTYFHETVKIIEQVDIDNRGHGHLVVVEGLGGSITIVGNIYSPVRGLVAEQEDFYEKLGEQIEALETKYLFNEPNMILLGDFN